MLKKRLILPFLLVLVLVFVSTGVLAQNTRNIRDDLDYLDQSELDDLQRLIDETVEQYSMDVVIVITEDIQGKSSMDYADDYYDYNGYGVGTDNSGLLLLVNMEDRELWVSTCGTAIEVFTDNRINTMNDKIAEYLSGGEWYKACLAFVTYAKRYMGEGIPEQQYNYESEYSPSDQYHPGYNITFWDKAYAQIFNRATYLIALIASVIITIMTSAAEKRQNTTNFQTYEEADSFKLINTKDDYLRETTTRVRVNSNSSGGGGSGGSRTHSSSSGRSHGGGGRSF